MSSVTDVLDPGDLFGGQAAAAGSRAQVQSSRAAMEELRRQFDIQQGALTPFRELALPGLTQASALAGVSGPEAQQQFFNSLQPNPGQEFREQEGERGILRNASVTGGLGGGNVLRDLQQFGVNSGRAQVENQFNRLSGLAGTAQTATGQLGQAGHRFATGVGEQLTNQSNAIASGLAGQQQAKSSAIGTAAGILGSIIASDVNIKTNIEDISDEQLFDAVMSTEIKAWSYIDSPEDTHVGPMYQSSPDIIKQAGVKALNLHNELWMIAGAMRHMIKVIKNG